MLLVELFENKNSNLVLVYPGRFHPFHIGHKSVYDHLNSKYSGAHVYIATSGKTDTLKSPFTFAEKRDMMKLAGVDPNAIVQSKSPYQADEILNRYDLDTTVVAWAVSEKDMDENPRFSFPSNGLNLKKNGEPAFMQKWQGIENAETADKHGYILTVPTLPFDIMGKTITGASQIREMISTASEEELTRILSDLYGTSNIPDSIVNTFKDKLQDKGN
jgi:hypothetical protein